MKQAFGASFFKVFDGTKDLQLMKVDAFAARHGLFELRPWQVPESAPLLLPSLGTAWR